MRCGPWSRLKTTATLAVVALLGGQSTAANELTINFREGRVTIVAKDVVIADVLREWARHGSTTIVHGDQLTGSAVTLALEDVPEADALEVVLRGVSGYVASYRALPLPTASGFARIVIVPASQPPSGPAPTPSQVDSIVRSSTGVLQLTTAQPVSAPVGRLPSRENSESASARVAPAGTVAQDAARPSPRFSPVSPLELAAQRRSNALLQETVATSARRSRSGPPAPQYADSPGMPSRAQRPTR